MIHKKMKTQPCLSPESPFMRKPSKELLNKLISHKNKAKQSDYHPKKQSNYGNQNEYFKVAFIPSNNIALKNAAKNQPNKLKKTTIQLGTFKIKHQNMLLKTQIQQVRKKNQDLTQQNANLTKQVQELRKQLETCGQFSRITKISQQTQQQTVDLNLNNRNKVNKLQTLYNNFQNLKNNKHFNIGSQEILQINSYDILPATIEISRVNSLHFDEDSNEDMNFLSTSLNRRYVSSNCLNAQNMIDRHANRKEITQSSSTQYLETKINFLQSQLQKAIERQRNLESQNESLRLCASMSKRRLDDKDSQLKEIKYKEKKKKYFQKLFQLSSQDEFVE